MIWETTRTGKDIEIGKTTIYDIFPPSEAKRFSRICLAVMRHGPLFVSYEIFGRKHLALVDYFEDGQEFVIHEVNYAPPMGQYMINFLIQAMRDFYVEVWG